ncbi:MAG: DUF302 domain-containing protein [Bryobacterales bacterium]|nr:DUF302 domain-containing protein [Bryobacteraceae bacterium]MDW8353201.1 DUF302 domain-containing protein [Bryobacterales bacterium]
MVYEVESRRPLEEIDQRLQEAAARHKFGIIAVHDLKDKMREKGVDFEGECRIYEVCNPQQAKKVLEANGAISTALPCRISVYRSGDVNKLATLRPTALMKLFQSPELEPVAQEVEQVLVAMMNEAA